MVDERSEISMSSLDYGGLVAVSVVTGFSSFAAEIEREGRLQ